MANLLSSGQKQGTIVSGAVQIPVGWAGTRVTVSCDIPSSNNTVDRSIELQAQTSDSEGGSYKSRGGFTWRGGFIGKDGTWSPSMSWILKVSDEGLWARVQVIVPVRTRFSVDIDTEVI